MAKYLSADDFLAGITCEPTDLNLPGLGTVQVRALPYHVAERIYQKHKDNEMALAFAMASEGLVTPDLSTEQMEKLRSANTGAITRISRRVAELSGLGDQEELENLVGGG